MQKKSNYEIQAENAILSFPQWDHEKIAKKFNLNLDKDKNTIVFDKEKNTGIKILNFITDLLIRIVKFIFILVILVLLTIGATVIINPSLRSNLLEILHSFNILT